MDSINFAAQNYLRFFVEEEPLGLQRVVASVMLDPTVDVEDCSAVEVIVLALIKKTVSLETAARMGISRAEKKPFNENAARMAAVQSVLQPNVTSDLYELICWTPKSKDDRPDRFTVNTAYHIIEAIVAADSVIRREAKKLITA